MAQRVRRLAPLGLAASLLVAVIAGSTAATSATAVTASALCIPSYTGSGPTIYIQPDYAHPGQSQVYYDSSNTDLEVHTCL